MVRIERTRRPKRDLQAAAASALPWGAAGRPHPDRPRPPGVRPEAGAHPDRAQPDDMRTDAVPAGPVPLETKLQPPRIRGEWLDRDELTARLAGTPAKLILVGAPAGFGKTTLVAQWRARAGESRRFAWVCLDRGDNDAARLWTHVLGALRRACPELGGGDGPRLPRATLPDPLRTLVPGLVNQLAALRSPVVLVLDDYHVISDRECHEQIGFLLAHLPRTVQVALVTRADPPLPLGRLRASGDVAEIGAPALRFGPPEVASLVRAVAGAELSAHDVSCLVARTEGWPAGVYLAALSLRGSPSPGAFVRQFTGNNRYIVDFLAEEVLGRQPPSVRRFLLRTSILDRFTAPLCEAVTGVPGAAGVIGHCEQEHLFLVPLDDDRQWYRYHHLFTQMLRGQLERTEPGIVPLLHERASAWHRARGTAEEAIAHALAAGDIRGAVGLIAGHWYELVESGRTATVHGWLRALGDDRIAADPVAAHCAAWAAALRGDRDSLCRWLGVVEAGAVAEEPLPDGMRSLRSSAALLRAVFGFGSVREMREAAALAAGIERDPASRWHALACAAHGLALYLAGEPGAGAAAGQAALAGGALPLTRMLALAVASLVACDDGGLARARRFAGEARHIAGGGPDDSPRNAYVLAAFGAIHARQDRLMQARGEFEHAIALRRRVCAQSPWPTVDIHLRLAPVLLDLGDRAGAAGSLAAARQVLAARPEGADALRARLVRLERRLAGAVWGTPLAEALTEREEAVLRMLHGTLTLREIGRELYLSGNTIKTHTRAIYRKLGVSTRQDAVERARASGILQSR